MKKLSIVTAVVIVISLTSLASASLRTVSVGDTLRLDVNTGYRTGNGGEFQVDLVSPNPTNNYFHTFCAEIGEFIYDDQHVVIKSVGLQSAASLPVNTLSFGAAKLYRDYYEGIAASNYGFGLGTDFVLPGGVNGLSTVTFSLSDSGAGRAADGGAVQVALWHLIGEGQAPALSGDALNLYNFYSLDANVVDDPNYFGVRIANLVATNGDNRQDQFVLVPEVSTIAVWSVLSLLGLGAAYRKTVKPSSY
jgi:hypothetical protein